MTLSVNELKGLASTDCFIDKNKLDMYSIDLVKITSKWNNLLVDEKMFYESQFIKYSMEKRRKFEYYSYDYQYAVSKGREMDIYLDSDIDLLKIKEKLTISKEKLNLIENTLKALNTSSFNVRNAIEFMKWQSGSY